MLDEELPVSWNELLECGFEVAAVLVVIAVSTPLILAAIAPLTLVYFLSQVN